MSENEQINLGFRLSFSVLAGIAMPRATSLPRPLQAHFGHSCRWRRFVLRSRLANFLRHVLAIGLFLERSGFDPNPGPFVARAPSRLLLPIAIGVEMF